MKESAMFFCRKRWRVLLWTCGLILGANAALNLQSGGSLRMVSGAIFVAAAIVFVLGAYRATWVPMVTITSAAVEFRDPFSRVLTRVKTDELVGIASTVETASNLGLRTSSRHVVWLSLGLLTPADRARVHTAVLSALARTSPTA